MEFKLSYFILCYNRSTRIPTLDVLRSFGITTNLYLVVGDDDPKLDDFGEFSDCTRLVFSKLKFDVDALGSYCHTKKICTYARAFVDDYARRHNLKYVCILFDDIKSIRLRYISNGVVKNTKKFNLSLLLNWYVELLTLNNHVCMIGPPGSSFYIGCNVETSNKIATHYGNMLIYDVDKIKVPYRASVIEDMDIVLQNSMRGCIGLFPFGLQVNCRAAKATDDVYANISESEYLQQWSIVTASTVDSSHLTIPYSKFIPKLVSSKFQRYSESVYENTISC